jgi:hypothetical protein
MKSEIRFRQRKTATVETFTTSVSANFPSKTVGLCLMAHHNNATLMQHHEMDASEARRLASRLLTFAMHVEPGHERAAELNAIKAQLASLTRGDK